MTTGAARCPLCVERARPFSDDFWRFGPDKGTSIDFWPGNKGSWRGGGKSGRGRFCGARHTPRPPFLTHARSLATHRCGVDGSARGRRVARAAEREVVCRLSRRDDDGAGNGSSEARRMIEGEHGVGVMGSTTGGQQERRAGSAMQGGPILPSGA